jgi:hypothetical protein
MIMKKIFTLVCMAMAAMSMNAQTVVKTFSVSNGDFTTDKHWQYVQVKDGEKAVANFEILSSPNRDNLYDDNRDECDENTTPTFDTSKYKAGAKMWEDTKIGAKNDPKKSLAALNELYTDALEGKGNPQFDIQEVWTYGENGWSFNVTGKEWTEGCGSLPGQGSYLRITPIVDGTIEIGINMNKGNHPLYIIDESTKAAGYTLLPASAIKIVGGYFNHYNDTRNYEVEGLEAYEEDGQTKYRIPAGKTADDLAPYLKKWVLPENRIVQQQPDPVGTIGAAFMGIIQFDVKKGVSYIIMSPRSQVGFYGFAYAYDQAAAEAESGLPEPTGPAGIESVKASQAKALNVNAPMYNLAGQQVNSGFKGLVIQNGKKFVVK